MTIIQNYLPVVASLIYLIIEDISIRLQCLTNLQNSYCYFILFCIDEAVVNGHLWPRVVRIFDLKSLASHCCGFESHQRLLILCILYERKKGKKGTWGLRSPGKAGNVAIWPVQCRYKLERDKKLWRWVFLVYYLY